MKKVFLQRFLKSEYCEFIFQSLFIEHIDTFLKNGKAEEWMSFLDSNATTNVSKAFSQWAHTMTKEEYKLIHGHFPELDETNARILGVDEQEYQKLLSIKCISKVELFFFILPKSSLQKDVQLKNEELLKYKMREEWLEYHYISSKLWKNLVMWSQSITLQEFISRYEKQPELNKKDTSLSNLEYEYFLGINFDSKVSFIFYFHSILEGKNFTSL